MRDRKSFESGLGLAAVDALAVGHAIDHLDERWRLAVVMEAVPGGLTNRMFPNGEVATPEAMMKRFSSPAEPEAKEAAPAKTKGVRPGTRAADLLAFLLLRPAPLTR